MGIGDLAPIRTEVRHDVDTWSEGELSFRSSIDGNREYLRRARRELRESSRIDHSRAVLGPAGIGSLPFHVGFSGCEKLGPRWIALEQRQIGASFDLGGLIEAGCDEQPQSGDGFGCISLMSCQLRDFPKAGAAVVVQV